MTRAPVVPTDIAIRRSESQASRHRSPKRRQSPKPVNIYELGLIYEVKVDEDGSTLIRMTLTSPMCPAAEVLPPEVETKARTVPGVTAVELDLVWEPPWNPDMMSEAAKLDLGMV